MYGENVQWISSFQATHNIMHMVQFLYLSVALWRQPVELTNLMLLC